MSSFSSSSSSPSKQRSRVGQQLVTVRTRLRKNFVGYGEYDGEVVSIDGGKCDIEWSDGSRRTMKLEVEARRGVFEGDENDVPPAQTPVRQKKGIIAKRLKPRRKTRESTVMPRDALVARRVEYESDGEKQTPPSPSSSEEPPLPETPPSETAAAPTEDEGDDTGDLSRLWRDVAHVLETRRRPLSQIDDRLELVERGLRAAEVRIADKKDAPVVVLEACAMCLRVVTAEDRFFRADLVTACLEAFRDVATNRIVPALREQHQQQHKSSRKRKADDDDAHVVAATDPLADETLVPQFEETLGRGRDLLAARACEERHAGVMCDAALKILAVLAEVDAVDSGVAKKTKKTSAARPTEALACTALAVVATAFAAYPSHRSTILGEAVALARAEQRASFRVVDGAHYAADGKPVAIRLTSALAMLLVQHSLGDRRGDDPPKFETAMRVAKFYCTAVIDRCKNAPEWRASAKLLVDDVTAVLVVPDWPAAETLSHALATVLVAELNAPLSKKKGALDFVGFVIDMLAPLAASIKRIEVAAHPIDLPRSEAPAADDEGCSTAKKSKATRSTRGKKRRAEEPAFNLSADIEQRVALQQLLLNAIGERTASEPWMANARAYQVARWYAALPADSADHVHRHVVRQWFAADGHSRSLRRGTWDVVLPARDLAPVARRVFVESSGLARALGLLVTSLANQLARENASLRSRAVKALDEVVRVDASLMANDIVRATVASRFRDEAISVRQAAVELVGAHALASSWETYESYHDALLARLADCGVSVRKSVVRILRSALEANATHAVHKHTLALLIERASVLDEEQTIKDLILTVVRDVWFSAAAAADADKKGSPRAAAKRPKNTTTTTCHPRGLPELDVTTRQIIDVVATSRSSEWVSGVVNSALQDASNVVKSEEASTAKATREYKRRHASVERAATHVDALVEHLLRLDEFRRRSRGEETLGDLDAAAAADVVATVSTLRTFAKARPSIVAPQLLVLAPYLRGDNGLKESHEGAVCCVVAETIMVCLESLPRSEAANVISVVVPDLLGIMHRFGTAPVAAAVRCLVTMSRARCGGPEVTARTQLARLASWYYDVLKRVDTNGGAVSPVAARATVVLGVACRWFPDGLAAAIGSKFVEAAYRALAKLFQTSRESPVRVVAAICDLVAGSPRFAVAAHDDGVLAAMLEHPNDSVRAKALSAWADVVNTSAIYDLTDDPRTFTDAKSADAAYVVAGATQARIPGLVAAMHVGSAEARAASLNLLGAILSHGLVNPLDVVPSVLAAMGDSSKPVARGAARLLFLEHEKRPQYVLARFVEGIVLCFRVRARRSEAVASGEEDDEAEVLRALAGAYARCVQPSKAGRYATLRRLVGLFSEERDVAVLAGVASLVATLPYASCDEPLFVVYHATRQAALVQDIAVGGLLGRIKADLQKTHRLSDTRVETYIPK